MADGDAALAAKWATSPAAQLSSALGKGPRSRRQEPWAAKNSVAALIVEELLQVLEVSHGETALESEM